MHNLVLRFEICKGCCKKNNFHVRFSIQNPKTGSQLLNQVQTMEWKRILESEILGHLQPYESV